MIRFHNGSPFDVPPPAEEKMPSEDFEKARDKVVDAFPYPKSAHTVGFTDGSGWAYEWCKQHNIIKDMNTMQYNILESNRKHIEQLTKEAAALKEKLATAKSALEWIESRVRCGVNSGPILRARQALAKINEEE